MNVSVDLNPDVESVEERLSKVGTQIFGLLRKYHSLVKVLHVSPTRLSVNNLEGNVQMLEDGVRLCDFDLQVLEKDLEKHMRKEGEENQQRIRELEENTRILLEKLQEQKSLQKEMEASFKKSRQRRLQNMKTLMQELKKHMSNLDALNSSGESKAFLVPQSS